MSLYGVYVHKPDGTVYLVDGPHKTYTECEFALWNIRKHFYNDLEILKLSEVSAFVCRVQKGNAKVSARRKNTPKIRICQSKQKDKDF